MDNYKEKAINDFKKLISTITNNPNLLKFKEENNTISTEVDNATITLDFNKGLTTVVIEIENEPLREEMKEFDEFIHNLEDDVFITTCNKFRELFGEDALTELDTAIKEVRADGNTEFYMDKFSRLAYKAAYDKIETLIFKYFPEYKGLINELHK